VIFRLVFEFLLVTSVIAMTFGLNSNDLIKQFKSPILLDKESALVYITKRSFF